MFETTKKKKGIFILKGDGLLLCLNARDDQTFPKEFSADFGSDRRLWAFKRVSATEKGGAKKLDKTPKKVEAQLPGTWRMVALETDGLRIGEGRPEIKESRLVIENASFTFFFTRSELAEPEIVRAEGTFTIDAEQTPPVIELTWKECPFKENKACTQRAIYSLEGDRLSICLDMEDDGKKAPTAFSAKAGSKRSHWIMKRDSAPKKDVRTNP